MTEQRRRQICAELARAMGWIEVVFACSPPIGIPPGEQDFAVVPDPFTDAADNRALVAWMAADDARWRSFFRHFSEALELDFDVEYPVYCAMLMMTASYEAITLAAVRALGIETE